MPYTVARPRPVPRPRSFVVKNGSKIRRLRLFVHADAAVGDRQHRRTVPDARRRAASAYDSSRTTVAVSIDSRPPCGIASRALTARFIRICSSCPASAMTAGRAGASFVTSSMSSPISRRSILLGVDDEAVDVEQLGWRTCLRLKASNWRVRPAARSAALDDLVDVRPPVVVRASRSSARAPRSRWITVSRLLKSCATPPANCPTASIFCAWRSCSSSRLSLADVHADADHSGRLASVVTHDTARVRQSSAPSRQAGSVRNSNDEIGPVPDGAFKTLPDRRPIVRMNQRRGTRRSSSAPVPLRGRRSRP